MIDFYPKRTEFKDKIGSILPGELIRGSLPSAYFAKVWEIATQCELDLPGELFITLGELGYLCDANPLRIKSIVQIETPPENSQARQVYGEASPRKRGSTDQTSDGDRNRRRK